MTSEVRVRLLSCAPARVSAIAARISAPPAIDATVGASPRVTNAISIAVGETLRPHLAAMEEQALAVERAAHGQGEQPRGVVRLTTVESLATCFLAPRLAAFGAAHPASSSRSR